MENNYLKRGKGIVTSYPYKFNILYLNINQMYQKKFWEKGIVTSFLHPFVLSESSTLDYDFKSEKSRQIKSKSISSLNYI